MHNNCTIIDYLLNVYLHLHTSIPIKASTILHYYVQFTDLPLLTLVLTTTDYCLLTYLCISITEPLILVSEFFQMSSEISVLLFISKLLEAKFSEMILRPVNKAKYSNENLQKEYQKSKKM